MFRVRLSIFWVVLKYKVNVGGNSDVLVIDGNSVASLVGGLDNFDNKVVDVVVELLAVVVVVLAVVVDTFVVVVELLAVVVVVLAVVVDIVVVVVELLAVVVDIVVAVVVVVRAVDILQGLLNIPKSFSI